jgi:ribosomal protein S18 acetylase RimI-like enzyme
MVAYRFCRPDDIPLLVHAVNRCFDSHFPQRPPLTVDGFRRGVREAHVWPSNCMVATAGDDPVAVVVGTKQPHEVRVACIGVAAAHQRRGHGRHLLESLGSKLAVLGPPRLVAEVPVALADALAFFAALGWREEERLELAGRGIDGAEVGAPAAAPAAYVRFSTEARPA